MTQSLDGKKALRSSSIFQYVSETDIALLEKSFRKRTYEQGETLFRQGEMGDSMVIIAKGEVAISISVPGQDAQIVDHSTPGDVLGEMTFFDPAPRAATVQAVERTYVYEFDRNLFRSICLSAPKIARDIQSGIIEVVASRMLKMEDQIAAQLKASDKIKKSDPGPGKNASEEQIRRLKSEGEWLKDKPDLSLATIPIGFSAKDLDLMDKACRYIRFPKDSHLCRQGEPGMACYFILRGTVEVYQEMSGQIQSLAILRPGSVVGQLTLVQNIRRSASLISKDEVLALEVTRADFQQFLQAASPVALKFQEQIAIAGIRQHRACLSRFSSILSSLKKAAEEAELAKRKARDEKTKAISKSRKSPGDEEGMDSIVKYLASLSEWGITPEILDDAVVIKLDGDITASEIKARLQQG